MTYHLYEKLILKENTMGLKKGTTCFFANYVCSSGYDMIEVVVKDSSFDDYMNEHNFLTLDAYLLYQRTNGFHCNAKYWTNPFNTTTLYPNHLVSLKQIEKKQLELKKQREVIEQETRAFKDLHLVLLND